MICLHVHCACSHHPRRHNCHPSLRWMRQRQSGYYGAVLFAQPLYGVDTSHLQLMRSLQAANCSASFRCRLWEGGKEGVSVGAGGCRRLSCQSQEIAIEEYTTDDQSTRNCTISANTKDRIYWSRGKLVSATHTCAYTRRHNRELTHTNTRTHTNRQDAPKVQSTQHFRERFLLCTTRLYCIIMIGDDISI